MKTYISNKLLIISICLVLIPVLNFSKSNEKYIIGVEQKNGKISFVLYNNKWKKQDLIILVVQVTDLKIKKNIWVTRDKQVADVKRYKIKKIEYGKTISYHDVLIQAKKLQKGQMYFVHIAYYGNSTQTKFLYRW